MSDPNAIIRSSFVARLNAMSGLPSVAWENVPFTPTIGTPYIKPFLLPGEPFQCEIGTEGANRHPGVYQISVFAPAGKSVSQIDTLVSSLCTHFKRGTKLSYYAGCTITILKAYPSPMMTETDWVHVPITIQYRVDAAN